MSTTCTKLVRLSVCDVPACGSPNPPGLCRPAIQGYTDNLLSPACVLNAGVGPAWDGVFESGGNCFWSTALPKTLNGGKEIDGVVLVDNTPVTNQWLLYLVGMSGASLITIWWGYSPLGTGGPGSSPIGLTFTAYFGPPPPFGLRCAFAPPTLKVVAVKI